MQRNKINVSTNPPEFYDTPGEWRNCDECGARYDVAENEQSCCNACIADEEETREACSENHCDRCGTGSLLKMLGEGERICWRCREEEKSALSKAKEEEGQRVLTRGEVIKYFKEQLPYLVIEHQARFDLTLLRFNPTVPLGFVSITKNYMSMGPVPLVGLNKHNADRLIQIIKLCKECKQWSY